VFVACPLALLALAVAVLLLVLPPTVRAERGCPRGLAWAAATEVRMIRELLVYLDQGQATEAPLQAALMLAQRVGAHVTALHLIAEPFLRGMAGHHLPAEVMREHVAHAEAEADAILGAARSAADRHGVALDAVRESGSLDRLPTLLARHARHTDLTVIGQPDPASGGVDDAALTEAAFMDSGHAALVVPRAGSAALPPRRAIVAWDGSREAARAATDAIPLLQLAEAVLVLVVDARDFGGPAAGRPGEELAAYLHRHAVKAEVRPVASGGAGIAGALLVQARDEAADLLVMGGYGHSRLREMLVGGTTRQILEHMTVPVLLAH
jgi:nucleotide-binding universal stress UspA family protein